jgi:hypothetical protein
VFGIIAVLGTIPLSKLRNIDLLEKDTEITKILQVKETEEIIEVTLAPEHFSKHRYLDNVFSIIIGTDDVELDWGETAIFCKEGEKEWYKVKWKKPLTSPKRDIYFSFNHPWKDYRYNKTKEIIAP